MGDDGPSITIFIPQYTIFCKRVHIYIYTYIHTYIYIYTLGAPGSPMTAHRLLPRCRWSRCIMLRDRAGWGGGWGGVGCIIVRGMLITFLMLRCRWSRCIMLRDRAGWGGVGCIIVRGMLITLLMLRVQSVWLQVMRRWSPGDIDVYICTYIYIYC